MLYDISPPLSAALAVWPGDVPFAREVGCDIGRGDVVTASAMRTTLHAGAHADAPSHVVADGLTIDRCALEAYFGPCQVIHVNPGPHGAVTPVMLPATLGAPRVLLRTGTGGHPAVFREDFAGLAVELADWLQERGVRLIGVDTPSVDRFGEAGLPVHRRLVQHDIRILENLDLAGVPAGVYELIALPLRLVDGDASPVRAVLRTLPA